MVAPLRVIGVDFDHMHIGDLLRMVQECPRTQIAGLCAAPGDGRMQEAAERFGVPTDACHTDLDACIASVRPDVALICSMTVHHAERACAVLAAGVHCLVEKPMAASAAEGRAMIAASEAAGRTLMVNWPLAWYPCHRTARRLVAEGAIGELRDIQYYDGNRGPLRHLAGKKPVSEEEAAARRASSWWYDPGRGGGSLRDYLGYGVTLGSWFLGGAEPVDVTSVVDSGPDDVADEQSVTVARYPFGMSRFETRWGTFTDPWTHQPQPKCGFILNGSGGTIASYDYEPTIRLQDAARPEGVDVPVDELPVRLSNPIEHLASCLLDGGALDGAVSPRTALLGQRIVDTALESARTKRTIALVG